MINILLLQVGVSVRDWGHLNPHSPEHFYHTALNREVGWKPYRWQFSVYIHSRGCTYHPTNFSPFIYLFYEQGCRKVAGNVLWQFPSQGVRVETCNNKIGRLSFDGFCYIVVIFPNLFWPYHFRMGE